MKDHARDFAVSRSWDAIFEGVYDAYLETVEIAEQQLEEKRQPKQAKKTIRAGNN